MWRGTTVISDFAYNPDNTISARADGDDNAIGTSTFGYDWADRLIAVDLPTGFSSAVPTFGWRADGLLGRRTWDSGGPATLGYDRAKRPTSLDTGTLAFDQAYDRDGNVTSESRSLPGVSGDAGSGSQAFAYDALNRLTGSSGLATGSRSYSYDLDGNRVSATEAGVTSVYLYDRTDQLVSVTESGGGGPTVFDYDAYGNLTSNAESVASVTTMTYDAADKLTGIDAAGTANDALFTFDALGRFRTRVLAASTDTYSYAGTAETVLRIANSASAATDSVVSPSGDRLGVRQGGTLNWFLPDLHGNVAASLDATEATVVSATRYDAYGTSIATGSGGGTAVGAANWKYQGRLDVSPAGLATPLYDLSARFYSPGLGTFTSLDSVLGAAQNPLSMNRFLYALANPATLIDPSGHLACNYGPDCNLIDYDPPPGMTDGVSPSAPPKPKDETSSGNQTPYKLPPGGSIQKGVYNPDWQPGVNPIPYLEATMRLECLGASDANRELLCNAWHDRPWLGPRACGDNEYLCLLEFIGVAVGGAAVLALASTGAAASAGQGIGVAETATATLTEALIALRDRLQAGLQGPTANAAGQALSNAAAEGDHIVLGMQRYGLADVARSVGGRTLMTAGNWEEQVRAAIANPTTRITVSLDGLVPRGDTYATIMSAVQRGASGRATPFTWELSELYATGRITTVTFMQAGRVISNPFAQ